jgi:hypothetical protein
MVVLMDIKDGAREISRQGINTTGEQRCAAMRDLEQAQRPVAPWRRDHGAIGSSIALAAPGW